MIVTTPFEIGERVRHPDLGWSTGLIVLGMTLGSDQAWTVNVTDEGGGGFWQFPALELELVEETLSNGTRIKVGPSWVVITLPNGREVHAHPDDESHHMALLLGYGDDVAAMTRDHDPLHARLTAMLGLPYSLSLMTAAGCEVPEDLTFAEESLVLSAQRFLQECRARGLAR